jgi:phosphoglycerol transferase MdoB-like AlkP superfamily enzyme
MGNTPRRVRALRIFALVAFVALLALGPMTEHTWIERAFTLTLALEVALVVAFATARFAFALLVATLVFGAIVIAGALKFVYLQTPVLAPDLEYFVNKDTIGVIARYPTLLASCLAAVIGIPLLLVLAFAGEQPSLLQSRPRAVRAIVRVLGTLAAAAVLVVSLVPTGPFWRVFNKPMWITINDKSFLTDFFTSFNDTVVTQPEIPAKIDYKPGWKLERPMQAPATKPDVVAILEESTFDPRILKACTLPECRAKMFDTDKYTRAHGLLTVHTFGGGTWTSEFAVLTGLAHTLFGAAGLYAPYNLAPRVDHTLPRMFRAAGYRAIAIYPMTGDFLNARNAYDYYGFDAFYDGTQYGLGWESRDADLLKVFERIYADEKRERPEQPLFVFMLTLHQHGPHMTPLKELPPPYDKPLFTGKFPPKDLDDWLNLNLSNYLERLEQSDAMMSDLEKYLLGGERPAVLMHFGDHQPSFDGAIHAIPKQVPKEAGPNSSMVTYYSIQSNYPVKRKFDYPVLDIAFLGALTLDIAGVPKDAFYQANTLLRERCQGRYLDCKDTNMVASYHDYVFNKIKDLREE